MARKLSRRQALGMGAAAGMGLAAFNLAGCAPGPTAPSAPAPAAATPQAGEAKPGQVFLNYWTGWSGFEFDALQALVDKFNKERPDIFVNMTTVFGQYDKVLTAIAGGNPPDVVSAVWLHQLVSLAGRDGLLPIEAYADKDGIDGKEYFPSCWDAWHYNGHLWGLAVTVNANVIGYRRDLFKEVGLDPDTPPKTIAEVDSAAQKLDKIDANGNIERYGLMPAGIFQWGQVFGGNFYDENNQKITANDPKNVAALDWMLEYAKRLDITKVDAFQTGFGDYMSPQNSFFVGKECMTQVGEWFISFVNKFAPGLDYDFIGYPSPDGGRPDCTTFDGSVFTIPKGVAHPDASWEFIKWLSQPENIGEFAFTIHNIPPKIAVANEDRFVSDPKFKKCVDLYTGKNAFGPPKSPVTDLYFTKLTEAEGAVKHGQMDSQAALDRVTQEVQAELDTVLKR
jgi:multiple sugar transport system substrate-binding protein